METGGIYLFLTEEIQRKIAHVILLLATHACDNCTRKGQSSKIRRAKMAHVN